MTKEEAKEIFLNRGFVNGLFDGDKWRQSIVVISEWLEQEPCDGATTQFQSDNALVRDIVIQQAEMKLEEFCNKWHLPYYEDNGEGSMGYEAYHLFDNLKR